MGVVAGCTMLILFLLCKRTNIIQPIIGKEEETPAILKWSLAELHTRFHQINLNDIERKTTTEEGDTVDKGIFQTYKRRKTTRQEGDNVDKSTQEEPQPGATHPILHSPLGTKVYDGKIISLENSDDEDEKPKKTERDN